MSAARLISAFLLFVSGPFALAGGQMDDTGLNPAAPPETAQWAFFIGEWDCATQTLNDDGSYKPGKARWVSHWALDGWALFDDWYEFDDKGAVNFHGINIRSFNPKLKKWEVRWLPQFSLNWKAFIAEKVGETIVMKAEMTWKGKPALDVTTWSAISADSFRWSKDISVDGGKTWTKGVFIIEARRVK